MARTKQTNAGKRGRGFTYTDPHTGRVWGGKGVKSITQTSRKSPRKQVPRKRNIPVGPGGLPTKWRPGTVALREIKKYQGKWGKELNNPPRRDADGNIISRCQVIFGKAATKLIIPKLPFQLLVKEIAQDIKSDIRITLEALSALQEGAEDFLVEVFRDTNLLALHREHQTVMLKDMQTALKVRRDYRKWIHSPENTHLQQVKDDIKQRKQWKRNDE